MNNKDEQGGGLPQRIILLAHGSRQASWAEPFAAIAASMRQQQPGVDCRLAYLEFMQPDLVGALLEAAREGLTRLRVVPLFLGRGNHVQHDIARQIEQAGREAPQLRIDCAAVAGSDAEVIAALARFALRHAG